MKWLRPLRFRLALWLGARAAGEQSWQIQPVGSGWQIKVQTDFGGVLPPLRRVQTSYIGPDGHSQHYAEGDGRGKASLETFFDEERALMTQRIQRDAASIPLLGAAHDPLSLINALRSPHAPEQPWHALMAGGSAQVQPLGEEEGLRRYLLRPGGAYVAVESRAPYRVVTLRQPADFGSLEAQLEA